MGQRIASFVKDTNHHGRLSSCGENRSVEVHRVSVKHAHVDFIGWCDHHIEHEIVVFVANLSGPCPCSVAI